MKEIQKNSPNHYNGRFGWKADVLVCHQTGGTTAAAALKWYLNPAAQCSPHFVVDTNGDFYSLVSLDNAAFCNGTRTDKGAKLYYGLATSKLVKNRKTNANYYTYSIEFVHCARGDITDEQVKTAIWLLKNRIIPHAKANGVKFKVDREHIIGHCEIDPVGRAYCPGKNFPYDRIIAGVLGKETEPKYDVKPVTAVYESLGTAAIRSEPSKSGAVLKRCKRNGYYAIKGEIEKDGETWLVHADGSGYSMFSDGDILFRHCGSYKPYKTTAKVNVRSAAELDPDNIICEIPKGTGIFVGTKKGEWLRVAYDGQIAYISAKYAKSQEVK